LLDEFASDSDSATTSDFGNVMALVDFGLGFGDLLGQRLTGLGLFLWGGYLDSRLQVRDCRISLCRPCNRYNANPTSRFEPSDTLLGTLVFPLLNP